MSVSKKNMAETKMEKKNKCHSLEAPGAALNNITNP